METVTDEIGYSGKFVPEPAAGIADLMHRVQNDDQYQLRRRPFETRDLTLTDAAEAWMQAITECI